MITVEWNATYTANFRESAYIVTFDSDGGSSVPAQTVNYWNLATKPTNPDKEWFTFLHWNLNDAEYNTPENIKFLNSMN